MVICMLAVMFCAVCFWVSRELDACPYCSSQIVARSFGFCLPAARQQKISFCPQTSICFLPCTSHGK